MGTYVYALKTKVNEISGVTVGVAEYRYKEYFTNFEAEELNAKMYNTLCKRRVTHFETNKLPFFFVIRSTNGKDFYEGQSVYSQQRKDGRVVGACFDDGIEKTIVGTMTKLGRSWSINWK
jgi:hypothetical protein